MLSLTKLLQEMCLIGKNKSQQICLAGKNKSQEICLVGINNYRKYAQLDYILLYSVCIMDTINNLLI